MNRTKLKNYAPQARKDFIQAVTAKAAQYGLTAAKIEPMTEKGDVVLIAGKPFPKALGDKRKRLEDRIEKNGFEQTMEAMAYTWFNRLVAIRYMELHGYLEHGFRVLSHPDGHAQPEILEKAQYVDLPGLDQKKVVELKLDGTKEEELCRLLLTAQFNALSKAMPFLFEKIDDETELLLPDSLLNSDSLIRKLVSDIDEEDWKEVEIIGWLYQFYISDKKDEVIGKVVKSEDIPAATQLFTPNWIVKYLVQNTIGRQWLATYPQSSLRSKMEYYIEPAEQTPEVQEQLKAITPTSLNPEELTLLDPACGSGHILVEAYGLFKAIYEERGYRAKDIPALILQKNLYGLEIDDRAAQLAAFALMMKARADYPRIFDSEAQPNVVSFVESKGLDADEIHYSLMSPLPSEKQNAAPPRPDGFLFETESNLFTHAAEVKSAQMISNGSLPDITKEDIASLVTLFENAKTFGSLIQVPSKLAEKLPLIAKRLDDVLKHGDLTHGVGRVLEPLVHQSKLLAMRYDNVVANPPYIGGKSLTALVKSFLGEHFETGKSDLYAAFLLKGFLFAKDHGRNAMVTMESWLGLSTYKPFRELALRQHTIESLVHVGFNSFPELNSKVVRAVAISFYNYKLLGLNSFYIDLNSAPHTANKEEVFTKRNEDITYRVCQEYFRSIPGSPIAFTAAPQLVEAFSRHDPLSKNAKPLKGMFTGDNERFLRFHWEINGVCNGCKSHIESKLRSEKWYPYQKGGEYRKWYGGPIHVVDFQGDGKSLKESSGYGERNPAYYFRPGLTWTAFTSSRASFRLVEEGYLFDSKGPLLFCERDEDRLYLLALLNSNIAHAFFCILAPTLDFSIGSVGAIPVAIGDRSQVIRLAMLCVEIARDSWQCLEEAIDFQRPALLVSERGGASLDQSFSERSAGVEKTRSCLHRYEVEINKNLNAIYDLDGVLHDNVEFEHLTIQHANKEDDIKRLLSYSIGCMLGRYSLDKPGLIYAHSGTEGFDPSQYKTFRADDDGIIPLLELDWGIRDDAANRIFEFISVAWPKEYLDENLKFITDSLSPCNGEQPKDTIRRYLATGFYKHHLSMYKKRPIYWLFSSGKQKAFQCLVYLHRYNEATLSRMRTEYVIPLMGKMTARLEHLQGPPELKGTGGEIAATSAVTVKRKLEKERDIIKKQLAELQAFDEKLRHYADLRIKLDLDDGVKVNYGKFSDPQYGDILAEVKAICGTNDED